MHIYWGTVTAHHFHLKVEESDQIGEGGVVSNNIKVENNSRGLLF